MVTVYKIGTELEQLVGNGTQPTVNKAKAVAFSNQHQYMCIEKQNRVDKKLVLFRREPTLVVPENETIVLYNESKGGLFEIRPKYAICGKVAELNSEAIAALDFPEIRLCKPAADMYFCALYSYKPNTAYFK